MRKVFYFIVPIIGVLLCFEGYSSIYGQTTYTTALIGNNTGNNLWQAIASLITGAVLTGSSFFFFIKRNISQYDDRHNQHEEEIANMQKKLYQIEDTLKKNLAESTELIMKGLHGLKDNLREIITDVAILKEDRRRCVNINDRLDNNTGGLKVLEVQFESLMSSLARLEKQIDKNVTRKN
jgi:hypothetical protein